MAQPLQRQGAVHRAASATRVPEGTVTGRALLWGALGSLAIGLGAPSARARAARLLHGARLQHPGAISLVPPPSPRAADALCAAFPVRLTDRRDGHHLPDDDRRLGDCHDGPDRRTHPPHDRPFDYAAAGEQVGTLILLNFHPTLAAPAGAPRTPAVSSRVPGYEGLPPGARCSLAGVAADDRRVDTIHPRPLLVMIAMMVILWHHWADNQRLTYPSRNCRSSWPGRARRLPGAATQPALPVRPGDTDRLRDSHGPATCR